MPDRTDVELRLQYALLAFVVGAAFPRIAYLARWPTRLGPRGLVAYVLVNVAVGFALRAWLLPRLSRRVERIAHVKAALRDELGRDPSHEELNARLRAA